MGNEGDQQPLSGPKRILFRPQMTREGLRHCALRACEELTGRAANEHDIRALDERLARRFGQDEP